MFFFYLATLKTSQLSNLYSIWFVVAFLRNLDCDCMKFLWKLRLGWVRLGSISRLKPAMEIERIPLEQLTCISEAPITNLLTHNNIGCWPALTAGEVRRSDKGESRLPSKIKGFIVFIDSAMARASSIPVLRLCHRSDCSPLSRRVPLGAVFCYLKGSIYCI